MTRHDLTPLAPKASTAGRREIRPAFAMLQLPRRARGGQAGYRSRNCWGIVLLLILLFFSPPGCSPRTAPEASPPAAPAPPPTSAEKGEPKPLPPSPITGLPYEKGGSLVAVMVENSTAARPQSGLSQADLVYEILAEGGITRFMALYFAQSPPVVGPVRSARPYFVMLAKEWGAIYAHCGGDPKDLEPIQKWKVIDVDEIPHGKPFWRDNTRKSPHNLYTSIDGLRKFIGRALPEPTARFAFAPWSENPVKRLDIAYHKDYTVSYRLKTAESAGPTSSGPPTSSYQRYMNDQLHLDRESQEALSVSNILIQVAKSRVAYPDGGLTIDLIGKGKASYVLGGRFLEGYWEKKTVESPTRFYTSDGQAIQLTPGQTWIQIVPETARVTLEK